MSIVIFESDFYLHKCFLNQLWSNLLEKWLLAKADNKTGSFKLFSYSFFFLKEIISFLSTAPPWFQSFNSIETIWNNFVYAFIEFKVQFFAFFCFLCLSYHFAKLINRYHNYHNLRGLFYLIKIIWIYYVTFIVK